MFKKLRELKPQDKIKLMELKTSFKQNVTVIENNKVDSLYVYKVK